MMRDEASEVAVPVPPRVPWRTILLTLVATRLLVGLVGVLAYAWFEKGPHFHPKASAWSLFQNWDANWYLDLVQHGYFHTATKSNVVIFPLYPGLMKLLTLVGVSAEVSGYLVSNLALLGACAFLWRIAWLETGSAGTATRAVQVLLLGPVSFFFSIIYSESLFLLGATGALYAARTRSWLAAGLWGAVAAHTRSIGFALVVPLLWEYLRVHGLIPILRTPRRWIGLAACLLPLAGTALYLGYMTIKFGDPLVYFAAQEHWSRKFSYFGSLFARISFVGLSLFYKVWFTSAVLGSFGLLLLGVGVRLRDTYLIFGLTFCFIYISSHSVEAFPRYASVVFPFYLVVALALKRVPVLTIPVFVLSTALLVFSTTLFVAGYWFT